MFPQERMECGRPGGIQAQRPGGSIQIPAVVFRIPNPDWREKSCPFECECSSVFQRTGEVGRQKSTSSLDRSFSACILIGSSVISSYSLATLAEPPLYCLRLMEPGEFKMLRWIFASGAGDPLPIPNPRAALRISWIPWSAQY